MNDGNPSSKRTVVEEGTMFKGTLASSCPIDVRGRIEGELETPELVVSVSGAVHGKAKVGSVRSEGELSGEFEAERIELAGTVRDNTKILARSLEVKSHGVRGKMTAVLGDCELCIGEEPTEYDVVEEPEQAPAEAIEAAPVVEVPADQEGDPVAPEPIAASAEAASSEEPAAPALAPSEEPAPAEAQGEAETAQADAAAGEGNGEASGEDSTMLDESDLAETEAKGDDGLEDVLAELSAPNPEAEKGSRKARKTGSDEHEHSGWSQPPSQPPPPA